MDSIVIRAGSQLVLALLLGLLLVGSGVGCASARDGTTGSGPPADGLSPTSAPDDERPARRSLPPPPPPPPAPSPLPTPLPLPSPPDDRDAAAAAGDYSAAAPGAIPIDVDVALDRRDDLAESAADAPPLVSKELRWVRVFFGTNRARTLECAGAVEAAAEVAGDCRPDRVYGGLPAPVPIDGDAEPGSDLEVGTLRVTFPPSHVPGRIERPLTVLTIALRDEDPDRDVVISELRTFPGDYDGWARELRATEREQAFVYVHGYATRFDQAARRAAQIAYDLDFDLDDDFRGVPMLYSWPSRGETGAYLADSDAVVEAADAFNRFLDLIRQQGGVNRVHVIAHSMGNQLVANALAARPESSERVVDELVLAAPDIWASRFKQRFLRTLPRFAHRVTLYVSDSDQALITASRLRKGEPRAGQVAGGLLTVAAGIEGFDAVDASGLETDLLGHSYYANNDSMLSDIYCLLKGIPADGRPLLVLAETAWRFRPPAERLDLDTALCAAPLLPDEPSDSVWTAPAAVAGLLAVLMVAAALWIAARRRRRSRA